LREVRDEDLPRLFEQWGDPVAVYRAAVTAPDHMDRDTFRTDALTAFLAAERSRPHHAHAPPTMVALRRVLEECGFRVITTERRVAEARSAEIKELVLRLRKLAPTE